MIAVKFGVNGDGVLSRFDANLLLTLICLYVAAFAWSWGPLGWLVPSEICPLEIRSAGQAINVAVNMIFTFIIAQVFLELLCHLKFGLFFFFAGFVVIMTIFVYFFLPETKNVPIEEMNRVWKQHWFWGKYIPDEAVIGINRKPEHRDVWKQNSTHGLESITNLLVIRHTIIWSNFHYLWKLHTHLNHYKFLHNLLCY